jgi:hypothetical protein
MSDREMDTYEAPSVEEVDTGGAPINTAAGTSNQIPG